MIDWQSASCVLNAGKRFELLVDKVAEGDLQNNLLLQTRCSSSHSGVLCVYMYTTVSSWYSTQCIPVVIPPQTMDTKPNRMCTCAAI